MRAISPVSVSSLTVMTGFDMTSLATRSGRRKLAKEIVAKRLAFRQQRQPPLAPRVAFCLVPADEIALADHADGRAALSRIGTALIWFLMRSRAISRTGVSRLAEITGLVIIFARIHGRSPHAHSGLALTLHVNP